MLGCPEAPGLSQETETLSNSLACRAKVAAAHGGWGVLRVVALAQNKSDSAYQARNRLAEVVVQITSRMEEPHMQPWHIATQTKQTDMQDCKVADRLQLACCCVDKVLCTAKYA